MLYIFGVMTCKCKVNLAIITDQECQIWDESLEKNLSVTPFPVLLLDEFHQLVIYTSAERQKEPTPRAEAQNEYVYIYEYSER